MSKCKVIISWLMVILAILFAFVLFPFLSSKLPDYTNTEFHYSVYKPQIANQAECIDNVFPWQYFNENDALPLNDSETIEKIQNQARTFLKSTMFHDTDIYLDFSQSALVCNSYFVYVHNYKALIDSKEYLLDLSYDLNSNSMVMIHCDSGGVYNRDIIANGEAKLKQIIKNHQSPNNYPEGNTYADNIKTSTSPLSEYLLQLSFAFTDNDLHSIIDDGISLKLNQKDICLCSSDNRLILYWNPHSERFEGYSINAETENY